jgi:hypothetical protein
MASSSISTITKAAILSITEYFPEIQALTFGLGRTTEIHITNMLFQIASFLRQWRQDTVQMRAETLGSRQQQVMRFSSLFRLYAGDGVHPHSLR